MTEDNRELLKLIKPLSGEVVPDATANLEQSINQLKSAWTDAKQQLGAAWKEMLVKLEKQQVKQLHIIEGVVTWDWIGDDDCGYSIYYVNPKDGNSDAFVDCLKSLYDAERERADNAGERENPIKVRVTIEVLGD